MDGSMLERILPWAVVALTVVSWISAGILVRAAIRAPSLGALRERAVLAVIIAIFGTVAVVVMFNTDTGHQLLPSEAARTLARISVLALLAVPAYWTWLYRTGRLGDGE